LVRIEPGVFKMGSAIGEKGRDLDEDPMTEVTFVRGFWIGKYEVTQKEFEDVMKSNPSWFKGNLNRPVEGVSWKEALAYCARVTELEQSAGRIPAGYEYRLPTEAEFEYVARAGATTRYFFGDDPAGTQLGDYAWYDKNSEKTTHPVGEKKPNPFGLYDIHGNVWEWCLDWYGTFYPGGIVSHPTGPKSGEGRVFRGGGWDYDASSCRAAYRNYFSPVQTRNYLGFRIVLAAGL
jgi:formylglycine-generating enzyme required for sulfatase activity